MTEILFIRHGETDYNKKNLYYGYLNPGLNEIGTNQLKNTKKKLEEMNEKIDIVFSSDLKRCRQSLELLELDENIEKIEQTKTDRGSLNKNEEKETGDYENFSDFDYE